MNVKTIKSQKKRKSNISNGKKNQNLVVAGHDTTNTFKTIPWKTLEFFEIGHLHFFIS